MRLFGASNCSLPSTKNGRFSGYDTDDRGSYCTACTSASTWEKSGLAVAFIVRLVVIPHLTLPPISGFAWRVFHLVAVAGGIPSRCDVVTGFRSITSPRLSWVSSLSLPLCARNDWLFRFAGVQVWVYCEC